MGKLAPRSCHLSAAGRTERQFKMESADINVKQKKTKQKKYIFDIKRHLRRKGRDYIGGIVPVI